MHDYKELFTNLKIKYDNLVTKHNKALEEHKKQLNKIEALNNDIKLQRNAVESELMHYVKLYNEAENKYLKEKTVNDICSQVEKDIEIIEKAIEDQTKYNVHPKENIYQLNDKETYHAHKCLDDLSAIKFSLDRIISFLMDHRFEHYNGDDLNAYDLNEFFEEKAIDEMFLNANNYNIGYEDIGDKYYDLWDALDKKFNKEFSKDIEKKAEEREALINFINKVIKLEKILREINEDLLNILIKVNIIPHERALQLYKIFCDNDKYYLCNFKEPDIR